ncbi:hypothetical protein BGZ91_002731, partial [Linnemannia elongata]
ANSKNITAAFEDYRVQLYTYAVESCNASKMPTMLKVGQFFQRALNCRPQASFLERILDRGNNFYPAPEGVLAVYCSRKN